MSVRAVTFDFYNTLVYHRTGIGRGRTYMEYLAAAGLASDPWEHQVLYDVFEYYAASYSPTAAAESKMFFWTEFTRRLFQRTHVRGPVCIDCAEHARAIRDLMGPTCLALFAEVPSVLRSLKKNGLRLGVISDWQKGLAYFCDELGISAYLDFVVASAEVGFQKPDPRLFDIACERMGMAAEHILHVGDRIVDVEGARAAGFWAALLVRSGGATDRDVPVITNLRELNRIMIRR